MKFGPDHPKQGP